MKVDIGNYEIDVLRLGAAFAALLLVFGLPFWYFVLRTPPALDSKPNTKSPYSVESKNFTYPFEGEAMKAEFAKYAITYNSGEEVLRSYPTIAGSFPAGFGQPAKLFIWFPEGALDASSDYSFSLDGYRYYRGVVVPSDDPAAFRRIKEAFAAAGQGGNVDAFNAEGINAVEMGFLEGQEPADGTEYVSMLGLYYWTTAYMNPYPVQAHYPVFLVGSYDSIEESAISDPPSVTIPSATVVRSGPLTITMERFELGSTSSRVLVTVSNESSQPVSWDWRQDTFVLADSVSYTPQGGTTDAANAPPDQLPTMFPQAVSRGYMFFPRFSRPASLLLLNLPLPVGDGSITGDGSNRWEIAWNLRNAQKATRTASSQTAQASQIGIQDVTNLS